MLGTAVTSFLVCAVFRLVPCQASVSPYFFFTRIMTTGFFMALSFQAGNTAYLYLTGKASGQRSFTHIFRVPYYEELMSC
jgi:hypothetical protein